MLKRLLSARVGAKLVVAFGLALLAIGMVAPKAHALIDLLWWLRR